MLEQYNQRIKNGLTEIADTMTTIANQWDDMNDPRGPDIIAALVWIKYQQQHEEANAMILFYLLAYSQADAERFAREKNIGLQRIKNITSHNDLKGIDGTDKTLWIIGPAELRNDYQACITTAEKRGFTLKYY